jgi:MFS family permease
MTAHTNHTQSDAYKWRVLALATFTFTFVVAIPQMSLPVMFDEISADLDLSLVQVGWIWGVGSVMGILVGLFGGPVGDRFGPRRTLAVACLFIGIAGAARGLSNGFAMLAFTMLITGFAQWSIPMNVHKTCGVWFSKEQLGMANGVVSVGMALGFLLGSLFAIPIALLSDRLGSRRGVLMAAALLIGIGTGLIGFVTGVSISVAVLIAGIARDGFMAFSMTSIIEVKGIGSRFAGSATGLNMSVMGVSSVFAPPVGNWLAKYGSGLPFLFWASLVLLGFLAYLFLRQPAT